MPNKAIFLDRDDTLIDDPGYISDPNQVTLLEGVSDALIGFHKLGFKLVVVTNQSGIARGKLTEDTLKTIHDRFESLLAEKNAFVDKIYYCPYHVDGVVEKYTKPSENRKPNPGMLLQAADDMDIDLSASWCIGNSLSDIEAGQRAGCRTIMIDLMSPTGQTKPGQMRPDYVAVNMREALNIVKQSVASSHHPAEKQATKPVASEPEHTTDMAQTVPVTEPETIALEMPLPSEPPIESQEEDQTPMPSVETPKKIKHKKLKPHLDTSDTPQSVPGTNTDHLLQNILDQLKSMQRDDMFDEFSLFRFVAGVAQIGVFVCLLIAVWFLLAPDKQYNPIFTALGFAVVLQVMCLTLTIQSRK